MAQGIALRLTLAALSAALLAGCGSASSTHTSGAVLPTTAAKTSPSARAGTIPAGFARYQGAGFSFIAPSGLGPVANPGITGVPAGASFALLTPGARSPESTNTQIIEGINPHLRGGLGAVATRLEAADANDPSLSQVRTTDRTMTVAGAQDVRVVSESYFGPGGGRTRTLFHRTWLMVSPKSGVLMDLVVVTEPTRGGKLDPATVLDSFRLGGHA